MERQLEIEKEFNKLFDKIVIYCLTQKIEVESYYLPEDVNKSLDEYKYSIVNKFCELFSHEDEYFLDFSDTDNEEDKNTIINQYNIEYLSFIPLLFNIHSVNKSHIEDMVNMTRKNLGSKYIF